MISSVSSSSSWASRALIVGSATQRHQEMFAKLDTNGDKKIDESELKAAIPAKGNGKDAVTILKEVNTSGDGTIAAAENELFLSKMDVKVKKQGPPHGGPPPRGAGGGAKSVDNSTTKVYDKLDTNMDGVVSLQELLAAAADGESGTEIQDLLKSMAPNVTSYDGHGEGVIDVVGGIVNTLA
jgi:Ca2+-binding EF-hand superfamily protein